MNVKYLLMTFLALMFLGCSEGINNSQLKESQKDEKIFENQKKQFDTQSSKFTASQIFKAGVSLSDSGDWNESIPLYQQAIQLNVLDQESQSIAYYYLAKAKFEVVKDDLDNQTLSLKEYHRLQNELLEVISFCNKSLSIHKGNDQGYIYQLIGMSSNILFSYILYQNGAEIKDQLNYLSLAIETYEKSNYYNPELKAINNQYLPLFQEILKVYNSFSPSCIESGCFFNNQCVSKPNNAYCVPNNLNNAWLCEDGYRDTGIACIKETVAVESCNAYIKGNIKYGTDQKIYHLPSCGSYNDTIINTAYGERYFCSEQEAMNAGWRKAWNCP